MARSPVFVVGSARSGTTAATRALLDAGYRGFREGHFLTLIPRFERIVDIHFDTFDHSHPQVMLSNVNSTELKHKFLEIFKTITEELNPEEPWLDKTANAEMLESIQWVLQLWPASVFIFLKRRGIENVMSRLEKFPKRSFEYHCLDWARIMSAWRDARAMLQRDQFLEVEQLDMAISPESVAGELSTFLNLDSRAVERLVATLRDKRPQQTGLGSAARISSLKTVGWSQEQKDSFVRDCGAEMTAFGYTLDESYRIEGR